MSDNLQHCIVYSRISYEISNSKTAGILFWKKLGDLSIVIIFDNMTIQKLWIRKDGWVKSTVSPTDP